jgi:hypothetical protein
MPNGRPAARAVDAPPLRDDERVEFGEGGGALHGAAMRHGERARRRRIAQAFGDAAALQAAGDEGGAETIARAGGVDLGHGEGRLTPVLTAVMVAGTLHAVLDHDGGDTQAEDLGDRPALAGGFGQHGEFRAARQVDVAMGEHMVEGLAHAGRAEHLAADVGVEGHGAPLTLDDADGGLGLLDNPLGGERGAHDVQVAAAAEQRMGGLGQTGLAAGAVADVVDEVAVAVRTVADEGAPRRLGRHCLDGADIDAVGT